MPTTKSARSASSPRPIAALISLIIIGVADQLATYTPPDDVDQDYVPTSPTLLLWSSLLFGGDSGIGLVAEADCSMGSRWRSTASAVFQLGCWGFAVPVRAGRGLVPGARLPAAAGAEEGRGRSDRSTHLAAPQQRFEATGAGRTSATRRLPDAQRSLVAVRRRRRRNSTASTRSAHTPRSTAGRMNTLADALLRVQDGRGGQQGRV